MPAKAKSTQSPRAQDANFVFAGTVRKVKAATMKSVPVNDRTLVVHVDTVMLAPEALSDYAGQDITVQLPAATRKKPGKGQQKVFYTNSWLFGESVAVEAVAVQAVTKSSGTSAGTSARTSAGASAFNASDPTRAFAAREGQERFASADLVVAGKVTSVGVPPGATAARASGARTTTARATSPSSLRVSEHDPLWRDAVIQVEQVYRGSTSGNKVIVRFPSSTDIAWYNAPKFEVGQRGLFLLHKRELGAPAMRALGVKEADNVYTALQPTDFQPLDQPGGIKDLINPSNS